MERRMLGIALRDHIRNTEVRQKSRVTDVASRLTKMRWRWVGHLARTNDNRWTRCKLEQRYGHKGEDRTPTNLMV